MPGHRVCAYRKSAWTIEDLEQDVGSVYQHMARKGLESIDNARPRPAGVAEHLLAELPDYPSVGFTPA